MTSNNIVHPDRASLISSIMEGYKLNWPKYIIDKICTKVVVDSMDIPFTWLIPYLYKVSEVWTISFVDHFIEVIKITNIELIRPDRTPMNKAET